MVLLVSFLIGVALVQQWNWETTLALICAFCGFQAEHPLVLQIKQRKSWQPRYWFWGVVYGGIAGAIALYLAFTASGVLFPLFTIYGCAGLALMVDAISVFCRGQKSILNELVTFATVCLVVNFTYLVTTHSFTPTAIRLWGLYRLYFSGTIFTVKLRKIRKQDSLDAALKRLGIYHAIAPLLILILYYTGCLPLTLIPALAFTVLLLKVFVIIVRYGGIVPLPSAELQL